MTDIPPFGCKGKVFNLLITHFPISVVKKLFHNKYDLAKSDKTGHNITLLTVASIMISMSFLSCADDNTDVIQINFTNVVGEYNGSSTRCEKIPPVNDSICITPFNNELKVILFDLNTIIINDAKELYKKKFLKYAETKIVSNSKIHHFISSDTTNIDLNYNEKLKSIKIIQNITSGGIKTTEHFTGIKK